MKGLNHITESVNHFTKSVKSAIAKPEQVHDAVLFDSLISITCFLKELGMNNNEFYRYKKAGRVDGLIFVAGKHLVDRTKINIRFKFNGVEFKRWLALGGRKGPVSVKENRAYEEPVSIKDLPANP